LLSCALENAPAAAAPAPDLQEQDAAREEAEAEEMAEEERAPPSDREEARAEAGERERENADLLPDLDAVDGEEGVRQEEEEPPLEELPSHDFVEMKPPPVAKRQEQEYVDRPARAEEEVRLHDPSRVGKQDDDDPAVFDNTHYDRELKIQIIFVLLVTVLGMLLYNIWKNKRKLRAGKFS
jgi:hypothetical protein